MLYKVVLRPAAQRDLKKLPEKIHNKTVEVLVLLHDNPRPAGVKKLKGQENQWRIRIGNFRILYEIYDKEKLIKIFRVAHRKEVYR